MGKLWRNCGKFVRTGKCEKIVGKCDKIVGKLRKWQEKCRLFISTPCGQTLKVTLGNMGLHTNGDAGQAIRQEAEHGVAEAAEEAGVPVSHSGTGWAVVPEGLCHAPNDSTVDQRCTHLSILPG